MIAALWRRWQQARESRAARRRAVPAGLWAATVARYPFLRRRPADDEALQRLVALFLDRKEFAGAHGLEVTDDMAVAIAAQACLPVLRLGLRAYDGFVGIVVHRDEVVARREVVDEDGVVHRYREVLSGEAMEGGPLMLSWRDVQQAGSTEPWAYNVVIHEFVHVIDMLDGASDGVPPLPDRAAHDRWVHTLDAEYRAFCDDVDAGRDTVLDPYGAEDTDEFFAVAAEAFFVTPHAMRERHAQLYGLFAGFFRQDPVVEIVTV